MEDTSAHIWEDPGYTKGGAAQCPSDKEGLRDEVWQASKSAGDTRELDREKAHEGWGAPTPDPNIAAAVYGWHGGGGVGVAAVSVPL